MTDKIERLKQDAAKTSRKIDKLYGKLSTRLHARADEARSAMIKCNVARKCETMAQRAKLYADAAREIDGHLTTRRIAAPETVPLDGPKANGRGELRT